MKKFICGVIFCSMLFSLLLPQLPVAVGATDSAPVSYEPEGLIYALEIVPEGEDLSDTVCRGEFAVMLASFLKLDTEGSTAVQYFNDVDKSSEYAVAIGLLYDSGYMSGDGKGNFRPNDVITYHEVLAAVVNTLDYGLSRYSKATYPDYHLLRAADLDISLKKTDTSVTRGEIYRILELALEASYYPVEGISDERYVLSEYESSVMEKIHKVYAEKGIVTQNSRTSLYSTGGSGEKNIIGIDSKTFLTTDKNIGERLGERVKYYYRSDGGDKTVLFSKGLPATEILEIESSDIESYSSYVLKYYENDKRYRDVKISDRANVIYNGVFYKKGYELTASDFEIQAGKVRLIANDGGVYEAIVIEDYDFGLFSRLSTNGEKMFLDIDNRVYIFEDYEEVSFLRDGKEIEPSEILPGEVLNFLEDKGKKYMTVYVTNDAVEGTLNARIQSEEETVFTIDGKDYPLSYKYNELNTKEEKIGRSDVFLLNMFGRIVAIENESAGVGKYGVILGIAEGKFSGIGQVKFLNSKNRIKIYDITKKTKINGTKYTSSTEFKAIADRAEALKGKLVAFDTNSAGELTELWIEGVSGYETRIKKEIDNTELKYKSGGKFFGAAQVALRDYTSIFVVGSTISSDEDCECVTTSYLDSDSKYYITTYNYDEYNVADAIIVHENANYTVDEESAILIVERLLGAINEDGVDVWYLEGMRDGKESKREFWFEQGSSLNTADFASGSILLVKASSKGEILAITKLFVYDPDNLNFHYDSSSKLGTIFGRVVRAQDDKCLINVSETGEDLKIIKPAGDIYVFNMQEKEVQAGSAADIAPGCLIFIRERYQSPQEIIIFEE